MAKTKAKRVVVALRLSTQAGQRTLRGIFRFLTMRKIHWDIRLKRDSDEFVPVNVTRYPQWGIDGIIYGLGAHNERLNPSIAAIVGQAAPIVAVDTIDQPHFHSRMHNIAFVNSDVDSISTSAAEFLIGQGVYRSYGYVPDFRGRPWSILRGEAFKKALSKRNLNCKFYTQPPLSHDDFSQLGDWLENLEKPAALFVAFDDRALTVVEACRQRGFKVPQDIAVLGVDDDELVDEMCAPSLSSVNPDHEKQGFIAAERLYDLMRGDKNVPRQTYVPILKVSERETTRNLNSAGALVQRALAYIHDNACLGISPDDVVMNARVSRRLLDMRFKEVTGTTLNTAIRDMQLKEVCRRLKRTNDTIDAITLDCGFRCPTYLKELFRKRFGTTMRDYRANSTSAKKSNGNSSFTRPAPARNSHSAGGFQF